MFCALLPAVVVTVRVAAAAAVPVMFTDAGRPQVGTLTGLEMLVVTAQERFTVPVKPLAGVKVIVAVLPVVAPGATVMEPLLLRLKLAGVDVPVTVALMFVAAVIFPVVASVPVTVTT